ncbi:LapA family protein [Mycolicibacterium goodii]|uniref:protein UsfY n=1 Tax=Mycolicibacterium goodii TaxID=134601 RepID=UPI001BDCA149|nr:protein UsfY [Mycolicibacterium goodii]MBU8818867.1 LapA family protein [Mycolicibacterium goodii]
MAEEPVDHARTTRPHAGETMKDARNFPGLALIAVALVVFVSSLVAFATAHMSIGGILVGIAAVGGLAGGVWLATEHYRVRKNEERWYADHPGIIRQNPS